MLHNVIIIGSGPSGHTAAIYCARSNLNPLVIQGHLPGGQLTTTTMVENYPGFPEGIEGGELMSLMKSQAEKFGTKYIDGRVTSVDFSEKSLKVYLNNGEVYHTKSVIISTGASPKFLGLKHEQALIGRGVSICATCDAYFYKNKKVIVVGGGDTALEEALFISKFTDHVTLVHRKDKLSASSSMQRRLSNNKRIKVLFNNEIVELIKNETGLTGIILFNNLTKLSIEIPLDGLFLGIGLDPNTSIFKNHLLIDKKGYIITENEVQTNVPGVYACGDAQDPLYRQAIVASGSGCQAALRVEEFLEDRG